MAFDVSVNRIGSNLQVGSYPIFLAKMEGFEIDRKKKQVKVFCQSEWNPAIKVIYQLEFSKAARAERCMRLLKNGSCCPRSDASIVRGYKIASGRIEPLPEFRKGEFDAKTLHLLQFFAPTKANPNRDLSSDIERVNEETFVDLTPLKEAVEMGERERISEEIRFLIRGPSKKMIEAWLIDLTFAYEAANFSDRHRIELLKDQLKLLETEEVSEDRMSKIVKRIDKYQHLKTLGESIRGWIKAPSSNSTRGLSIELHDRVQKGAQFMHALNTIKDERSPRQPAIRV